MKNARITTTFGSVDISYTTQEELIEILNTLPEEIKLIEESIGAIKPAPPRLPKPGFESAYRFIGDKIELLVNFPEGVRAVALTLFAFHPYKVSVKDIQDITGIENFKESVIQQSAYKTYFKTEGDKIGLTDAGQQYVLEKIKPKLPTKTEEKAE